MSEDTVAGRYASTLFIAASKEKSLYNVYEDMRYLSNLYENLESFRIFSDNSGLNATQIFSFSQELAKAGEFSNTTLKFLDLLGKNKRFMYINEIAKKYIRSYLLLTKEEKITIISAQELTQDEQSQVKRSLMENPENEGKTFVIDYSVNPNIAGGLQMYTENKFMDLSLASRIDKIKDELSKLI
jgi:ATP synthase F1 delta subunit